MIYNIIFVVGTCLCLFAALFFLLHRFRTDIAIFFPILFLLALFAFGFLLRLSGESRIIDLGFFMTEFSHLAMYGIFATALLLGQAKYWKVG